ncbi:MAG: HAMP domain-containing sensor histidine kinase [Bacillota bacterium]
MKLSIKYQIVIAIVSLCVINFILQLAFNLFFAKEYYTEYQSQRMETLFQEVKDQYDGTAETVELIATEYENEDKVEILLTTEEDSIYTSFDKYIDFERMNELGEREERGTKLRPDMFQMENGQEYMTSPQARIMGRMPNNMQSLRLLGSFEFEGENVMMSISLPVASMESSVRIFTNSSMMISSAVLLIGVAMAMVIARGITKPIFQMERVAHSLSELDFTQKVEEESRAKEIASLGKSINSMSDQLEKSITDLSEANAILQKDIDFQKRGERMRREFVANVSHEMKTPLSLLQLYAASLRDNVEEVDREYYLDTIIEETEHLNSMVMQMLNASAIESGMLEMTFETIDIGVFCGDLVTKFAPILENHVVETTLEENLMIRCDVKYMEQAMKNYIVNAVEHTKTGGHIRIAIQSEGENVIFSVFNEGKTIPESDILQIWNSFYRGDQARTHGTEEENIGMGLSIVKTIVEKHDGTYNVKNIEDVGVEFSIFLKKI